MSQLISFYEQDPVDLKRKAEVAQRPMAEAVDFVATSGPIQPRSVYVIAPTVIKAPTLIVPFGSYDDWSLRDRYNEALRIMTTLGASEIQCESFRRVTRHTRLKVGWRKAGVEGEIRRVENSGFDFRHVGAGAVPHDPAPLKWPDEPGFESARANVLYNGSQEVAITINSSNTFTLGSDLGAQLKKLGFDLGVSQERSMAHTLHITARFPGPPEPAKRGRF